MNSSQNPNPQTPPDYGQTLMSWRAPEYEKQKKSRGWFITAAIIGVLLIGSGIWMRNYIFIIVVVMFAVVLFILHKKEPLPLDIAFTEKGIKIGEKFHLYRDLENFWIIYEPPVKTLNFKTRRGFFPEISVQLANQNPVKIRESLLSYLTEDESREEEGAADRLTKILKI